MWIFVCFLSLPLSVHVTCWTMRLVNGNRYWCFHHITMTLGWDAWYCRRRRCTTYHLRRKCWHREYWRIAGGWVLRWSSRRWRGTWRLGWSMAVQQQGFFLFQGTFSLNYHGYADLAHVTFNLVIHSHQYQAVRRNGLSELIF